MRRLQMLAAVTLATATCLAGAIAPGEAKPRTHAKAAAVHPVSGLPIVPLTITHRHKRIAFRVELARTSAEQARGLMFRTKMSANEGMIFPMVPARYASFWMRNTVLPLDIVFIGEDNRIISIAQGTPYSEDQIMSGGLTKAVLELNVGRAAALGITTGDKVVW